METNVEKLNEDLKKIKIETATLIDCLTVVASRILDLRDRATKMLADGYCDGYFMESDPVLSKSIYDCGLSTRAANSLRKHDIDTVGGIVEKIHSVRELRKLQSIGGHTAREISNFLAANNLYFGMKQQRP
jgi:DNA-directed RNA polymerase alpha subunit